MLGVLGFDLWLSGNIKGGDNWISPLRNSFFQTENGYLKINPDF